MATVTIDQERCTAFEEKMVDIMNCGALSLMISIGHRTGLFDTMSRNAPGTTKEIADAANLNDRYVREWLGAMVVSGVVEYDEQKETYQLPAEHASFLTREAAPNNLAALVQYIPLLGTVEDHIVECFKNGGGVPYSAYGRFQEVMAEDSGQSVLPALIDHILPLVPGLKERLAEGIDVLDIGCGSGLALNLMAQYFPNSRFTGYDLSEEGVARGMAEAKANGLSNIRLKAQNVAEWNEKDAFDLITAFDAIHDQATPDQVLRNVANALRSDGVFLMQDIKATTHVHGNIDHPIGPLLYTISCMHCMSVSLAQDGAGLGAMWGEQKALEMLGEAGFTDIRVEQLEHDIQNQYYIARKNSKA